MKRHIGKNICIFTQLNTDGWTKSETQSISEPLDRIGANQSCQAEGIFSNTMKYPPTTHPAFRANPEDLSEEGTFGYEPERPLQDDIDVTMSASQTSKAGQPSLL
jgi:hypothetical protein